LLRIIVTPIVERITGNLPKTEKSLALARSSEPFFNVPAVVLSIIVVLVLIQAGREWLLTDDENLDFLLYFAFIPARYDTSLLGTESFPGGVGAQIWTFLSYAFLHADFIHVDVNSACLLPFGAAMARRFGTLRFLAFLAATAASSATLHFLTHQGDLLPMIGTTAAVSGLMAGSLRFIFQIGGPLAMFRTDDEEAYRVPAAPLAVVLRDSRIIALVVVWFGINLLFGVGASAFPGIEQSVAWKAQIGGFVAGLTLFALFDPVPRHNNTDSMLSRCASLFRSLWLFQVRRPARSGDGVSRRASDVIKLTEEEFEDPEQAIAALEAAIEAARASRVDDAGGTRDH
jgi:membrane associated rhomboid family serine protease